MVRCWYCKRWFRSEGKLYRVCWQHLRMARLIVQIKGDLCHLYPYVPGKHGHVACSPVGELERA